MIPLVPTGFRQIDGYEINVIANAINALQLGELGCVINGSSTGVVGDVFVPAACTIKSVTLLADQAGSIVVDIWKSTYASYPPTSSICGSDLPTLASQIKSQDSSLTGWSTKLSAGDILRFNVNSISTVTRVTLVLSVLKS